MKDKLSEMKINNQAELVAHIKDYSNKDSEDGNKNAGFQEDILILLDVITIFLKMRDSLNEKSKIYTQYDKKKKEQHDQAKTNITNLVRDTNITN